MAGGKGSTYKNNYLTWALTALAAPIRPTSWTIALYTDAAGLPAGGAGPVTEAIVTNCPGYARQSATFAAPSNGSASNNIAATFTGTAAWATINYFAVLDQAGAIIEWAPLTNPRTIAISGDKIDFAIGQIVINES